MWEVETKKSIPQNQSEMVSSWEVEEEYLITSNSDILISIKSQAHPSKIGSLGGGGGGLIRFNLLRLGIIFFFVFFLIWQD